MAEIAEQALDRIRLQDEFNIERKASQEISAARAIGDDLDALEGLAAQILSIRNTMRVKARGLYTGRQVGDAQTSEAELVAAPLRARIRDLEARWAESMAGDHQTIVEQRQRIAELESQVPSEVLTMPAECVSVGRLTRQLDVAHSQISALQRRKDELAARVADMQGWLDLKTGELASANEQRDSAREQERRVRAAWQTEIERGRDLEAELSRLREELPRRMTQAQVADAVAEASAQERGYTVKLEALLRRVVDQIDHSACGASMSSMVDEIHRTLDASPTSPGSPSSGE